MKKIYSFLTVAALLLAGFTSCAVDQDGTTPQNTTPGHGTKVTIKINNGAAAKTRATAGTASTLTGADRENQITNLYAVLYKDKNSSYAYYKTFACTQDATNTDEYTFDVEDEAAGGVYYMYLIANPTTELKTVFDNDNAGASANSIDTEADLYAFTVTPVLGPTADDTDNTKNNINKVTDFVMTSPRVQLDMAGDEETVVGGTDGITLTRLAARFDIDATALNITNADPSKETTFQITKVTMNKRYTESDLIRGGVRGISMVHPTTASTDLASSANVEFDKFLTETDYVDADGKYWKGAIYSCENYDTTDPVVLTIEGVYKHGENQALTVSQNVVFKDIQRDGSGNITSQDIIPIQRNHLYKVILTPKYNNGALVFGEMDYAIQVNDWQTGETLVFAGNTNLTATSIPDFEAIDGVVSVVTTAVDGKSNPTTLVASTINASTVKLKVTSATTGTMMECPEFDSSKGRYDIISTSNDENGNLVEIYQIDIYDDVLASESFTFTIHNAISTELNRSFMLSAAPFIKNTNNIQYGDIYYANNMWSRAASYQACRTLSTPTGVIAPTEAKVSTDTELATGYWIKPYTGIAAGDVYFNKGYWVPGNSTTVGACKDLEGHDPIGVIIKAGTSDYDTAAGFSHAYVIALKNAVSHCQWAPTNGTYANSLATDAYLDYPETKSQAELYAIYTGDMDGYKHCMTAKSKVTSFSLNNLPAMYHAENYRVTVTPPASTSGWYLPSIGQIYELTKLAVGGTPTLEYSGDASRQFKFSNETDTSLDPKLNKIFSDRGLTGLYDQFKGKTANGNVCNNYWTSSEKNPTQALHFHFNGSTPWLHGNPSWIKTVYAGYSSTYAVRSVLAF